jgi:hypothetical protein
MKKLSILILSLLITSVYARGGQGGPVYVHGYTKQNGTHVDPHFRTSPDGTKLNNWSHVGNVNPYTGKIGTNTDSTPNYQYKDKIFNYSLSSN